MKSERKLELTMQEVAFIRQESQRTLARNESCREKISQNKIKTTEDSLDRKSSNLGLKEPALMRSLIRDNSLRHYQDHLSSGTGLVKRMSLDSSKVAESPEAAQVESGTFRPYDVETQSFLNTSLP